MASGDARRLGRRAEEKALEAYGLEPDRTSWRDGVYKNGVPVEVKASQRSSRYFRLWADEHHRLASQQGYYVFVLYRPRGTGVEIIRMKRVRASDLSPRWSASGHAEKRQLQAYIPHDDVM